VVVGHLEDVPPVRWAIGAARVARSTLCRDGEDSAACRAATMPSVPESLCRAHGRRGRPVAGRLAHSAEPWATYGSHREAVALFYGAR
jgi:hypothetical protein